MARPIRRRPQARRAHGLLVAAALGTGACQAGGLRPGVCEGPREVESIARALQCGPTLELTPIHEYRGEIAGVEEREEAVVLINGTCTGTLIAAEAGPVVVTAGHCVALGDRCVVAFNVEDEPDGERLVTEGTVIERADAPDYALIRLDAVPAAAPTRLTRRPGDLLAVIQHPRGRPKVIAEGVLAGACDGKVHYAGLDTLVGSSGAGVLNRGGHLVAVHSDGDCAEDGSGTNRGWSAERIVEASPHLLDTDIADR